MTPSQQYEVKHEVLDIKSEVDDDMSDPDGDLQGEFRANCTVFLRCVVASGHILES